MKSMKCCCIKETFSVNISSGKRIQHNLLFDYIYVTINYSSLDNFIICVLRDRQLICVISYFIFTILWICYTVWDLMLVFFVFEYTQLTG